MAKLAYKIYLLILTLAPYCPVLFSCLSSQEIQNGNDYTHSKNTNTDIRLEDFQDRQISNLKANSRDHYSLDNIPDDLKLQVIKTYIKAILNSCKDLLDFKKFRNCKLEIYKVNLINKDLLRIGQYYFNSESFNALLNKQSYTKLICNKVLKQHILRKIDLNNLPNESIYQPNCKFAKLLLSNKEIKDKNLILRELIQNGIDVNKKSNLHYCLEDFIKRDISRNWHNPAFILANYKIRLLFNELCLSGWITSDFYSAPLVLAAISGDPETIEILIKSGADLNTKIPVYGTTSLMLIIVFLKDDPRLEEIVELAIEYGAEVNAKDNGPLFYGEYLKFYKKYKRSALTIATELILPNIEKILADKINRKHKRLTLDTILNNFTYDILEDTQDQNLIESHSTNSYIQDDLLFEQIIDTTNNPCNIL